MSRVVGHDPLSVQSSDLMVLGAVLIALCALWMSYIGPALNAAAAASMGGRGGAENAGVQMRLRKDLPSVRLQLQEGRPAPPRVRKVPGEASRVEAP